MTVIEVIQKSTEFLTRKGIESPRLQIELILAHVLKMPRMKLYLNFDRQISEPEMVAARQMTLERSNRKPLQHILGSAPFFGGEFQVNRNVLVPRPETELLVEESLRLLNVFPGAENHSFVMDYGTGSGCIGITLARQLKNLSVTALDKSPEALAVADSNAQRHGLTDKITFLEAADVPGSPFSQPFHLFVSNPPYIPSSEIASLEPEVKNHDPLMALDGGADGLEFYRKFAGQVPALLLPGGALAVEFGDGQADAIKVIFDREGWTNPLVLNDLTGRERVFSARRPC
ncbi:MAG: hemK [Verrucomicrobiales bacterium]|nr:hemK [Verrucomicrobiales bacterium]